MYGNSGKFSVFMKHSPILWDQLQIIMKICGPEMEDKGSYAKGNNNQAMAWKFCVAEQNVWCWRKQKGLIIKEENSTQKGSLNG
jgi:hypothetical protein